VAGCGWESRDLRVLLEEHWTRNVETYEHETALIGDLDSLDVPSTTATVGKGGAGEVRALLDRIRAENPNEPLWTGVRAIEPAGNGVEVQFEPADSPKLRRAGGVDVACVLYPE
jgi:peptide/nickel transport system ATP-binding protein